MIPSDKETLTLLLGLYEYDVAYRFVSEVQQFPK